MIYCQRVNIGNIFVGDIDVGDIDIGDINIGVMEIYCLNTANMIGDIGSILPI